ncbi:MAG: peptidylprolyl isomerase [Rhodobacterales bacterium]|nr:peptidylprolyl isomerase [Rhodobacterales bacterium]
MRWSPRPATLAGVAVAIVLSLPLAPSVARAQDKNDNPVVATVNGVEIRDSEVRDARTRLPQQYQQLPMEVVFPLLLNSLIDTHIIAAAGRAQGLGETDEVKDALAKIEDQLIQRVYLRDYLAKAVSDADLHKLYDARVAEMADKEEVRASHILLESEEDAKAVIAELDGGADFAELAKTKSTGPSGPNGGDLGYFEAERMVPEFAQAAFAMDVGTYSKEPVKTQFGWHVIKVVDRRKAPPPSFEELEDELRVQAQQDAGAKHIEELRKTAEIKRFNADGTEMTEEAPNEGAATEGKPAEETSEEPKKTE